MFQVKRAAMTTGVMSFFQNGGVEGPMHYGSGDSSPEIAVSSSLDSQNGNVGSNDTPKRPKNLGVNTTLMYSTTKNLRESSDDIEDGSLPCTPELADNDTRSLLLDEEFLKDLLKQLVQDRPGLLHRLRVKRVRPEDFPPSLKLQYSESLLLDEEFLKDLRKQLEQYRADPEPSCVSMKSNRSKDYRLSFKLQHSKHEQDRADPPEPSCVSMKSNRSTDFPLDFKQQHSKVQQETSDVSTGRRSPLDSVFMFLEENVAGFVKNELKKFKEMLSPDYPECPEDQCEDEGVVDEEEAQRRYSSTLVLKMTLLFMKRMNLGELADSLEKRSVRLLEGVAENKRHNGAFTDLMSAVNMLFSTCFR